MAKSSSYWDKRKLKRLTSVEKNSEVHIKRIKGMYDQAYKDIERELVSIYKNYSKETGLDTTKLKELLTRSQTQKTWEQMKKQGLDKYVKDNYKARISRLEQLQAQIYAKAKLIYPKEELESKMCYKGVINESYYKAVYDTQMGTGYDFAFSTLDNNMINNLLSEKWSGQNYSERIWGNTDILANSLSDILGGALISGQGIEKTAKQIRDRFNVGKYYSERLVRTETNHFNNEVDALAYEEMGIKKYVFVATLDSRTSEMCQYMDNKVFEYDKREVGVNFPPLHPNCRSTTRGYLGADIEKDLKRRATNPMTGESETVDNVSYKKWLESHNDNILQLSNNGNWAVNNINKGINDNFKGAYKIMDLSNKENATIYNNMNKLGVRVFNDGGRAGYYNPANNSVHIPKTSNARANGTTIHELGHAIDFNLGKPQLSLSGNLSKYAKDYYDSNKDVLPKEIINYMNSVKNKVAKKYNLTDNIDVINKRAELSLNNYKYDAGNRLCDMFSALSKGSANDSLFAKHGKDYWKNSGTVETELFAQFTYLKMTNSKKELKVLEKSVPNVYNELNSLYTKASKEIRRL